MALGLRGSILALLLAVACDRAAPGDAAGEVPAAAPDTIVIDGMTPSCATCTLVSTHVVSLGGTSDREIHRHLPDVRVDSRGYYYAGADGWSNDLILRYDSTGRYLGTLGSRGNGPGEYTMFSGMFLSVGDSVFVRNSRGDNLVFAPTGAFVRSFRVPVMKAPLGLIAGAGGAMFAVGGDMRSWINGGSMYAYIVNADATPRDSFEIWAPRLTIPPRTIVAGDGSLWTLTQDYRLERHGSDGRKEQLIGVITPSFPTRPVMTKPEADSIIALRRETRRSPVQTREQALKRLIEGRVLRGQFDATGLAWITTLVPAPDWDRSPIAMLKESDEAPMENLLPPDDESALRNTIVEVIDTKRGQLLARTQLPFGAQLFAPGLLARPTSDANGHLRMEIHRVTLTRN